MKPSFPLLGGRQGGQAEEAGEGVGGGGSEAGGLAGELGPGPGRGVLASQGLKGHLEPLLSPAWIKPVPEEGRASGVPPRAPAPAPPPALHLLLEGLTQTGPQLVCRGPPADLWGLLLLLPWGWAWVAGAWRWREEGTVILRNPHHESHS